MKSFVRSLLVLIFIVLSNFASAQFQVGANFNVIETQLHGYWPEPEFFQFYNSNYNFNQGSVPDGWKLGFGGTLVLRYSLNDNIRLGIDLSYYRHGNTATENITGVQFPINLNFEYVFNKSFIIKPYFGMGIGITSTTITLKTDYLRPLTDKLSFSTESLNLMPVLGARYGVNKYLDIDVNIKYNITFYANNSLGSLPIGVGVIYKFQ